MSTSEISLGSRPGLSNAVDIVVAPNAAFSRLRQVPTWGWAFLIGSVIGIIGALMIEPALIHAMETSLPAKLAAMPQYAKLPADQQASAIAVQMKVSHIFLQLLPLFVPVTLLVTGVLQALVMTIANAVGRGDGSFTKYFALSITVSIVGYALATLVLGPIVMLRGASSFETQSAIMGSLPNLGLLAPGLKGFLGGFLGAITVFYVWGMVLLALGMQRVGRIAPGVAWAAAIVMLLLTAVFAGWGAAFNG